MSKEKRLGRGLAALLGSPGDELGGDELRAELADRERQLPTARLHDPDRHQAIPEPHLEAGSLPGERTEGMDRELLLSVSLIEENPFQPRREFGESEIESLAESLKEHDMLQPVLVRRVGTRYQLISGERRLRAARAAGWKKIPARIREADDRLVAELAIVENLQRKDLNPIEKALSFQRYLQQHQCTQEDLGKRLKIDRSTIANLLRLLELPAEVQTSLQTGEISNGHARALLPLGDRREQIAFCHRIREEGMSVRDTERQVSEAIGRDGVGKSNGSSTRTAAMGKKAANGQIAALEQAFRHGLGTKVEIKSGAGGRGKIVIHFKNHDEFERLQALLLDEASR